MDGIASKNFISLIYNCQKDFSCFSGKDFLLIDDNNFRLKLNDHKSMIVQALRNSKKLALIVFIPLIKLVINLTDIIKIIDNLVIEINQLFKIDVALDFVFEDSGFNASQCFLFNTNDFEKAQIIFKEIIFNLDRAHLSKINIAESFSEKIQIFEANFENKKTIRKVEDLFFALLEQKNIIVNSFCMLSSTEDEASKQIEKILNLDRVCQVSIDFIKTQKLTEAIKWYVLLLFFGFMMILILMSYLQFKKTIDLKTSLVNENIVKIYHKKNDYKVNNLVGIFQEMLLSDMNFSFVFPNIKSFFDKYNNLVLGSAANSLWPRIRNIYEHKIDYYHTFWALKPDERETINGAYYSLLVSAKMLYYKSYYQGDIIRFMLNDLSIAGDKQSSFISKVFHNKIAYRINHEFIEKAQLDLNENQVIKDNYHLTVWYANHFFKSLNLNEVLDKHMSKYFVDKEVPFIFTKKAYLAFVKPSLKGKNNSFLWYNWFEQPIKKINYIDVNQFLKLYKHDYFQFWELFLKSLKYNHKVELKTNQEKIIYSVIKSTLSELVAVEPEMKSFYKQFVQTSNPLVLWRNDKSWGIYKACLLKLNDLLQGVSNLDFEENNTDKLAKKIISGDIAVFQQIVTVSNKLAKQYFPHSLSSSAQHFLLLPVRQAWKMILLETTHNLELKWRRSVYPYYETKLMNKWPYANMTSS
ncbi:MAG: hypothetical protein AB7F64_04495, partial [Gammaproteobacteria bacterium]